jgi:hypothetical protein
MEIFLEALVQNLLVNRVCPIKPLLKILILAKKYFRGFSTKRLREYIRHMIGKN